MGHGLTRLQHIAVLTFLNTLYCIISHLVIFKLTMPPKLQTPLPHPLIATAYPMPGEDPLDITEAETETIIKPYRTRHDLGRKAVTATVRGVSPYPQFAYNRLELTIPSWRPDEV